MKIMNIVDEFYPDTGYENNVLSKYFVKYGYEYCILTTDKLSIPSYISDEGLEVSDKKFTERTGVKVIRLSAYGRYSGRVIWKKKLFNKAIEEENPDVLFFCGNDTLIAMQYMMRNRKLKRCVIMDSHMLEMASTNAFKKIYRLFYKKFITPKIIKNQIPVIRQQNSDYVEKRLGIPLSLSPWISFGSDTLLFKPDAENRKVFREQHGISKDAFVVVYAGKIDEAKDGKLLASALLEKFNTDREIVVVIVGTMSGQYGEEVKNIFDKSSNRIIFFNAQKYNDLPAFYQASDLALFARQCSLSFYDVQACGLPVISEDNDINVDRNSFGNGLCFKAGDVNDFRAKIQEVIDMPTEEYQKMSQASYDFVAKNYNYEDKAKEYMEIIEKTYSSFNEKKEKNGK